MSRHRGVLAAVSLLLLAVVPACGFADDNYENAQNALDRSRPDLTVPATVTTMKPFQTLPGEATGDSIPVELATPEQRAAALAEAQQRAEDRKAGRPGLSDSSGRSQTTDAPGTAPAAPGVEAQAPGSPKAGTTTATPPETLACRASRSIQTLGLNLVLSTGGDASRFRETTRSLVEAFTQLAGATPVDQRPVVEELVRLFLPFEARISTTDSVRTMRSEFRTFLAIYSGKVARVVSLASLFCPEVLSGESDQVGEVDFSE